jgi:hypothetical protein
MKSLLCLLGSLFLASTLCAEPAADKTDSLALVDEVRLDVGIVSKLAATLAATLANKEAKRMVDVEPFSPTDAPAVFRGDHWEWRATVGYGKGDMVATISFGQDGSGRKVDIRLLVNELSSRRK